MTKRKHKPKKCGSDQMVREGCESSPQQAVNNVMRKFCQDVERRKADEQAGILAELAKEPREA